MFENPMQYYEAIKQPREKPVVHCVVAYGDIVVGRSAHIVPSNHPAKYLNGEIVITSTVVDYNAEQGKFETRNTLYVLDDYNHPMHGAL